MEEYEKQSLPVWSTLDGSGAGIMHYHCAQPNAYSDGYTFANGYTVTNGYPEANRYENASASFTNGRCFSGDDACRRARI